MKASDKTKEILATVIALLATLFYVCLILGLLI
jgi:hypothetical protein